MSEFDTNLPSIRKIQTYIKDKQKIVIQLNTAEKMTGQIIWQDSQCLGLSDESGQSLIIWRQALVYIKTSN